MIFTGTEPGSSTCRTVISLAARNCYSGFSHIAVQAIGSEFAGLSLV